MVVEEEFCPLRFSSARTKLPSEPSFLSALNAVTHSGLRLGSVLGQSTPLVLLSLPRLAPFPGVLSSVFSANG